MVDWGTCDNPCEHCKTDARGNRTEDQCPDCGERSKDNRPCPMCQNDREWKQQQETK